MYTRRKKSTTCSKHVHVLWGFQMYFAALVACAWCGMHMCEGGFAARPLGPTFDQDDIDRSSARHWVSIEASDCIAFNSVDPFDPATARLPARFAVALGCADHDDHANVDVGNCTAAGEECAGRPVHIASGGTCCNSGVCQNDTCIHVPPPPASASPGPDPAAAAGFNVTTRALLLYAPLQWDDLRTAYRAFLHLETPLVDGACYTVTATGLNASWNAAPITLRAVFNGSGLNTNIRVNQIGYLPAQPKRAWLGQYAGSDGRGTNQAVRFFRTAAATFDVIDATTGKVVLTAVPELADGSAFNLTGQELWTMDFTSLVTPGWFRVRVPGVGVGHVFQIGDRVFNQVAAAAHRGAYHARCGCALDANLTRFSRGVCHAHDAVVMPTSPLPKWFQTKFNLTAADMFPEAQRPPGTVSRASRGHHDAGDYGKYTVSGSMFVSYTLLAYENATLAARLDLDDGQIPEAHNVRMFDTLELLTRPEPPHPKCQPSCPP